MMPIEKLDVRKATS